MALAPCDSCRRHVRAGEAACPFCKAVRNVTTAAAVAVATVAIAGCDTFSPAAKYGGPPPDYPTATSTADAPDASIPPPAPAPSTTASSPRLSEPEPTAPVGPKPTGPVAMYGGPPRR